MARATASAKPAVDGPRCVLWHAHQQSPRSGESRTRRLPRRSRYSAGSIGSSKSGRDYALAEISTWLTACSAAKESADERLAVRWHSLPTPYLFELADVPYALLAQASGADTIALVERNLKKKRVQLRRNQERRGGGGGTAPAPPQEESEEEAVKVINALLDWCRGELFPFLAEVDARMAGADPVARASFLYQTVINPLREISRQKMVTRPNPEIRADT